MAVPILLFDGVDDYVEIGTPAALQVDTQSVAFWLYPEKPTTGTINTLYSTNRSANNGFEIRHGASNIILIVKTGTTVLSNNASATLATGAWAHIAVTANGPSGVFKIYINGALVRSESLSATTFTHGIIDIGRKSGFLQGRMREFRAYSSELSAGDVSSIYSGTPPTSNLRVYYKMDEGTGTSLTDSSGNSVTGTIGGSAAWGSYDPPTYIPELMMVH